MTQSEIYLEHVAMKLKNLGFVGTRSFNGIVRHEGRGGWSSSNLPMEKTGDRWGMSPFLFPDGVDAVRIITATLSFMEHARAEDSAGHIRLSMASRTEAIDGRAYLERRESSCGTA